MVVLAEWQVKVLQAHLVLLVLYAIRRTEHPQLVRRLVHPLPEVRTPPALYGEGGGATGPAGGGGGVHPCPEKKLRWPIRGWYHVLVQHIMSRCMGDRSGVGCLWYAHMQGLGAGWGAPIASSAAPATR